jgi:hypothetical protein
MNAYQEEQSAALRLVRSHPETIGGVQRTLATAIEDYLAFRRQTDAMLQHYFAEICTSSCYRNHVSACCTKDSIVVFFADVVLNTLVATAAELDRIDQRLHQPNTGFKCIFLGEQGCLWHLKPIVCQMFLCEPARTEVFGRHAEAQRQWALFEQTRKTFTWPDRPVLFDQIESIFLKAGLRSSLMHLHFSPGLIRIKRQAGLWDAATAQRHFQARFQQQLKPAQPD